mgnify:CR=1 FL=1
MENIYWLFEVSGLEEDGSARLGNPLAISRQRISILKARSEYIKKGYSKRSLLIKQVACG